MLIISPSPEQNTPAIEMPYREEIHEVTQRAGNGENRHLLFGQGFVQTGEGLAIKWQLPRDLTGAPWQQRYERDAERIGTAPRDDRSLRLQLLARKYGRSKFSREDEARLEILNERLRCVMQRVSNEDVIALESAAKQLEDSRELRKRIAQKYGL